MNRAYQFSIIRFVPNSIRDESVNVGVLIQDVNSGEFDFKLLRRTAAIRKLDPDADSELVKNFEEQLRRSKRNNEALPLIGRPSDPGFFERAIREFNGTLQFSGVRGMVAPAIDTALKRLFDEYVAEPPSLSKPIAYQTMAPYQARQRLWSAFERRKLLASHLVRARYSVKGQHANWVFDLGYQNGAVNLISSVSLVGKTEEINLGRALVFRGMVEEVRKMGRRSRSINAVAVVQLPKRGNEAPGSRESQRILKDSEIGIVDISDLSSLVDTVAKEISAH